MEVIKSFFRKNLPELVDRYRELRVLPRYYRNLYASPKQYPKLIMKDWVKYSGDKAFDLKEPKTYRQKIQWSKLYDGNQELKTMLTDKVEVRNWISEKIGPQYLTKIYGIFNNPDDIDFDSLPDRFVIKMNHSSGQNIIIKDKSKINTAKIRKTLRKWMKCNYGFTIGLQLHYKNIIPKIIVEEFMEDRNGELNDYKFLCFNGQVFYCWIDTGRYTDHHKRFVYDMDWNLQPWSQKYTVFDCINPVPDKFEEMKNIAAELCKGFGHVRVDLYNVDGKIYFGEMTFTNGNGYEKIIPTEYDSIIGDLWKI